MDYTQCANVDNPAQTCDSFVANATALNNPNSTCTCRLELVVNQELRAPVHVRTVCVWGGGVGYECTDIHTYVHRVPAG